MAAVLVGWFVLGVSRICAVTGNSVYIHMGGKIAQATLLPTVPCELH